MESVKNQLKLIIEKEGLKSFNLFDSDKIYENEVGIYVVGDVWTVYATDERADPRYESNHDEAGPAIDDFLYRLRLLNEIQRG